MTVTTVSELDVLKEKLGKPYFDLEFLLQCLKEVLEENGEKDLTLSLPWINGEKEKVPETFTMKHIQLYSIVFQLLNMAEENGAVQNRRKRENEQSLSVVNGLWAERLKFLKEQGVSEDTILETLPEIEAEPVLTAHPTEAKRATVLEHHRELYLLIVQRENKMYTEIEQEDIKNQIKLVLDRLWRTGEIFVEKPDVESELRNVLHYLVNVFPVVVPIHDRRLYDAWAELQFDTEKIKSHRVYPKISFGDWVGGDRDGNPFVTDQVTQHTLRTLRLNAFVVIRREMIRLIKHLSFSYHYRDTTPNFRKRIDEMKASMGGLGDEAYERNRGEIFRQYVNLCIEKLPIDVKRQHATELKEEPYTYRMASGLINDLELLQEELIHYGAAKIAYNDLNNAIRIISTFGFHLAKLDIRQNSSFHDKAIAQLLSAASLDGHAYLEWDFQKRLEFFNNELQSSRPFTHFDTELEAEAKAVTTCYDVVSDHVKKYGISGLGALIVSMTRDVTDLLAVYILARESGLTLHTTEGLVCKLPVVPLFETIEDLDNSSDILTAFLDHPITQRSLRYRKEVLGESQPVQQVMIGYSDSNKDGGILASQWFLYEAQKKLSKVGKDRGIKIKFFHGKGGSISRGAGPTNWFIQALPVGSLHGVMRVTEQGETISQKYANKINATFNIEQLMAGAASQTIFNRVKGAEDHPLAKTFSFLAWESKEHYSKLINNKHFIPFYSEATPIDVIEASRIGSRPARRSGKRSLEDLRAIPWVFSWSQSRYNMTSWYGVGYTLNKLKKEDPDAYADIKKGVKDDSFIKYVFTNVDTSLAATNENVMKKYADLVENEETRKTIFQMLLEELKRTRLIIDDLFDAPFKDRRTNHYNSNLLRESALTHLHDTQIAMMRKFRKMKAENASEAEIEPVLLTLLMTVNAIASALRSTG